MRMQSRLLTALLVFLCWACVGTAPTGPTAPAAWSGLTLGPHPVRVELIEIGRYTATVFRPARRAGPPAAIADLAEAHCGRREESAAALLRRCLPQFGLALSDDQLTTVAATAMSSAFSAPPAVGRYPLVVLQGSVRGRGFDHVAIAEALASHGFVVAVTALAAPPEQAAIDAGLIADLRRGVGVTVRVLSADRGVDAARLALGGWSVGSVPALLYALGDREADAFVSFDGGVIYAYGAALVHGAPGIEPGSFGGGLLLIEAGVENSVPKDASAVDALINAQRQHYVANGLTHGQLSNQGGALLVLTQDEGMRTAVQAENARVAEATRVFLERHLR